MFDTIHCLLFLSETLVILRSQIEVFLKDGYGTLVKVVVRELEH